MNDCTGIIRRSLWLVAGLCLGLQVTAWGELAPSWYGYYEILPETAETNGLTYRVARLNVEDGDNIFSPLQNLFENIAYAEEPVKIVIPPGNYTVSSGLHMFSDTWVYMPGVTITYQSNPNLVVLRNGWNDTDLYGYEHTNIIIEGSASSHGAWKATPSGSYVDRDLMHFVHVKDLVIRNLDFHSTMYAHHFEASAVDGLTIENCRFTGTKGTASPHPCEAIQIDVQDVATAGASYGAHDGTLSRNIRIVNNQIIGVKSGMGTHSVIAGQYITNVVITGNVISNATDHGINATCYKHATIASNRIVNCAGIGIIFRNMCFISGGKVNNTYLAPNGVAVAVQPVVASTIADNTITMAAGADCGIRVYGAKLTSGAVNAAGQRLPTGDYRVSGLTITGNDIQTTGSGIHVRGLESTGGAPSSIVGNRIVQTRNAYNVSPVGYNIVHTTELVDKPAWADFASAGVTVASNLCDNSSARAFIGIAFRGGGGFTVQGNTVIKPYSRGIFVLSNATTTTISGNTITEPGAQGISLEGGSVVTLTQNLITSPGATPISLYSKSKATITGNTIDQYPVFGIDLDATCKGSAIRDNVFASLVPANVRVRASSTTYRVGDFAMGALKLSRTTPTSVKVTWGAKANATDFVIYRRQGTSGAWTKVKTQSGCSYTSTGLTPGKSWYFKVYARRSLNGNTVWSKSASKGTTLPAAVKVTFNPTCGSCGTAEQWYYEGKAYGSLPAAKRSGCTFAGWYTTSSGGTRMTTASLATAEVTTLYARFQAKYTFNANGGKCGTSAKKYWVAKACGSLPTATRSGYQLVGWYTAKSGGTKVTTATKVTKGLTLYARWARLYKTTFNANGGTCATAAKNYGAGLTYGTLPVATRKGRTFQGWYTAKTSGTRVTTTSKVPAKARTLYAQWALAESVVTLDATGGTGGTATVTATYGATMPAATAPTRDGYAFLGYFSAAVGGTQYYKADMSSARVWNREVATTLYAQWEIEITSVRLYNGQINNVEADETTGFTLFDGDVQTGWNGQANDDNTWVVLVEFAPPEGYTFDTVVVEPALAGFGATLRTSADAGAWTVWTAGTDAQQAPIALVRTDAADGTATTWEGEETSAKYLLLEITSAGEPPTLSELFITP